MTTRKWRSRSRFLPRWALATRLVLVGLPLIAGSAHALEPAIAYSLRDGPIPDGVADDLILPPDSNYGRVFQSSFFDAEFYAEFVVTGGSTVADAHLALALAATDMDLVYGESKTFRISTYPGDGVMGLETFGSGSVVETVTLPTNGLWDLDVDVTDLWNEAVLNGDDFFGIRIHDPVWAGTQVGAGTIIVDGIALEGVPEPELSMLLGAGVLLLTRLSRRRPRE